MSAAPAGTIRVALLQATSAYRDHHLQSRHRPHLLLMQVATMTQYSILAPNAATTWLSQHCLPFGEYRLDRQPRLPHLWSLMTKRDLVT